MSNHQHEQHEPNHPDSSHSDFAGSDDCSEVLALIPAYSIGATDPVETQRVESLLPQCPEAIAELADYMALSDAMLFSSAEVVASKPASMPAVHPLPTPKSHSTAITQPMIALPTTKYSIVTKKTAPARPRQAFWWLNRLAIVAAAAALILSNGWWWTQTQTLRTQQQQFAQLLAEQEARYAALGQQPARHQALTSTQGDNAHGIVIWEAEKQIGTLYAAGLAPLQANHVYQLWIATKDHEVSLGTFRVDAQGTGTLVFKASEPIMNFDAVGVSIEPGTGSAHPTTPMGILGTIERG